MATKTRRRRNARRKTSQRRGKSGRFVKTKRTRRRRARAANPVRRRRRRTRASNPVRRRRRRAAAPVRRRRRRRNSSSSALAASVSSGPRAVNRRRRRKTTRRRRRNSSALSASVSAGKPRAVNRRRRRNMRRRRNVGITKSFAEIFSPRAIGAMLVGSSVRGAAGGASMTALSALLGMLPDQIAARKPVVVLPAILGVAVAGKWLEATKLVSRMRNRYFDPEDISRGIADQFRDVLYLTIAGAAPGAAPILGIMSPAVASQLALAPPADASGILVQTTAGQRRTRGIVAQSAAMPTRGLSYMGEEESVYGDPDMG